MSARLRTLSIAVALGALASAIDSAADRNPKLGIITIDELSYNGKVKALNVLPFPIRIYNIRDVKATVTQTDAATALRPVTA